MKKEKPIRILIAEDHEIVREGLAAILNMQNDMVVVAETGYGEEAIQHSVKKDRK